MIGELYLELLKTIREVNKSLDKNKKIRVLAGDPTIHWETIQNQDDYLKQIAHGELRHVFPTQLIQKYGIEEQKKIVVIYSECHLTKIADPKALYPYETITTRVNKIRPNSMKSIGVAYTQQLLSDMSHLYLKNDSVIELLNHPIGEIPASIFWYPGDIIENEQTKKIFDGLKLSDIFDALIYLGPHHSLKWSSPNTNNFDTKALAELNRRKSIFD